MSKPPLELTASIGGPSGRRWRYAPAAKDAGDRPLDLSFNTEAGEGFATGQLTLSRPYDQDTPDLHLLGDVVIEGYDGQIAYEGRVQGTPRSLSGQGPQIRMDLEGWMSHARQQPFTDLLIDRDLGAWGEVGPTDKVAWAGASRPVTGPSVDSDNTSGPAVAITLPAQTKQPIGVALYRAPHGAKISHIGYTFRSKGAATTQAQLGVGATDAASVHSLSGNLRSIVDQSRAGGFTPADPQPFGSVRYNLPVGLSTPDGDETLWIALRVVGDHGIPISDVTEPTVMLSDAIGYLLGRYAPKLDLSRMVNNGFPVAHAVWREPVTCHDALKELNVYAQWALGVFENRQVEYRPFDLSQYDWQVRAGQDGVEVETQGVTTEQAFNGVTVSWPDYAGNQNTLTPNDTSELADTNPAIAANQWGDRQWATLNLSRMTSQEGAITQARLYLADLNRPKFPSTITVPGHIKDNRNIWQPAWRVRANQTISVRNHPNDAPRLITSTSWQGNRLTITCDNALNRFEAITARLDRARADKGM